MMDITPMPWTKSGAFLSEEERLYLQTVPADRIIQMLLNKEPCYVVQVLIELVLHGEHDKAMAVNADPTIWQSWHYANLGDNIWMNAALEVLRQYGL